jgi:hypothetical protein
MVKMHILGLVVVASCTEHDQPTAAPSQPTPRAHASPSLVRRDPCALLAAADFAAAGLVAGTPKRESNLSDGACTWTGVRGKGGVLTVAFITAEHYDRRQQRTRADAIVVRDLGDQASITKRLAGHDIAVKRGDTYVLIDGNARLTPELLPTLARAVVARL